jgi:hypothetical protein
MKHRPPEPSYPWWWRLRDRVFMYVTWPWAVHRMKQQGFTRVGWMSWATGPLPRVDTTRHEYPRRPPLEYMPEGIFSAPPSYPWATPDADVLGDLQALVRRFAALPARRDLELRCTGDVLAALQAMQRNAVEQGSVNLVTHTGIEIPLVSSVHIIEDDRLPPGTWELWENGQRIRNGQI